MEDLSEQINFEGSQYTELPAKKPKKKNKKTLVNLKEEFIEDITTAVENDEVANDPLEDLEEANGKVEEESEASEEPNLDELEYADGKERDELDLIEEKERIYGINKTSPYGTANYRIFAKKLETMSRGDKRVLCEKVGARVLSSTSQLNDELTKYFKIWQSKNGSVELDSAIKAEKGALSDAFGSAESVNDLEEELKSQTLSDLQSTAARLGFNPGFDRDRLITLIKQEYQRQS
jgi:hypothetical protein